MELQPDLPRLVVRIIVGFRSWVVPIRECVSLCSHYYFINLDLVQNEEQAGEIIQDCLSRM